MTRDEATREAVVRHMEAAREALDAAAAELADGRARFAMNRVYYACFYAASAVLLSEGRTFVKHTGVKAAVHQHLVNTGRLSTQWGSFYNDVFEERHEADYDLLEAVDATRVQKALDNAIGFVDQMQQLLVVSGNNHQE